MQLFDLVAGFVYSQTLVTCIEAGVLRSLSDGALTKLSLARAVDLPLNSLERLLGAATALRLVEPVGRDAYALGAQGAALLGNPGLVQMVEHHRHFYADLADGVELLRTGGGGGLAQFWPYATASAPKQASPEAVADYSALMAATLPSLAADLLGAYPFARHRALLDVGGGEGAFLRAASSRSPQLELMLFDLPAVIERARKALAPPEFSQPVKFFTGDFLREPLPRGADLVTLIRVIHDHDDEGVMALFKSIRASLSDGGVLIIAEPMSANLRHDRIADVYFALYLHAMGRGRARTPAEIRAFLQAAGFRRTRALPTRSPFLLRALAAHA